jgi:NADPH:quinone reductase
MRALQFSEFGPVSNLRLVDLPDCQADSASAIVKVVAASITPSDVKNVQGKMQHTTLPRVPGRDHAGVVVQGPSEWIGAEVWGTGGDVGYSIDGSHAEMIVVPIASLRRKPRHLSFEQAAAIGVTYLAAWLGLVESARITADETLLVIGANGGVGSAVAQIGKWRGARVIGADRQQARSDAPEAAAFNEFLVLEKSPLDSMVRGATNNRGAEVGFDTID